jgi:hypothetical protein
LEVLGYRDTVRSRPEDDLTIAGSISGHVAPYFCEATQWPSFACIITTVVLSSPR